MIPIVDNADKEALAPKEKMLTEVQGITSDLPVNVSVVIDKSSNIQVEQAHSSKDASLEVHDELEASVPPPAQPPVPPVPSPQYQGPALHQIILKLIKLKVEPGK